MTKIKTQVSTYRDVPVFVTGSDKRLNFSADVAGQHFTGPSWESLVAKLDQAIGFEARDIAVDERPEPRIVRVVGREKTSYGYRFIKEDGEIIKHFSCYDASALPILQEKAALSREYDDVKAKYGDRFDKISERLNALIVRAGE